MADYKVQFTKSHWMFPNYKAGDLAILEEEDAMMLYNDGCASLLNEVPESPEPRSQAMPSEEISTEIEVKRNKLIQVLISFRTWLSKKIVAWLGKYTV